MSSWFTFFQTDDGSGGPFSVSQLGHIFFAFGIFFISAIIYWQYKKVTETKNTVVISKYFLLALMVASIALIAVSAFSLANRTDDQKFSYSTSLISAGFFLFLVNLYTLKVKLDNCSAAKEASQTEEEHYESAIAPTLELDKVEEVRL